jgi:3-deoxy-7-phosphoheptulonate synthase
VPEALDTDTLPTVAECADIIQIGSRSMQNAALLRRAGRKGKAVLLERGMAATIDELLQSTEYIPVGTRTLSSAEGHPRVRRVDS